MIWQRMFLPAVIIFHFFLLINSSFTVWPEMILYPYFMNNGFLLYKDIVNPYFPGLSLILSQIFYMFGTSILNLKFVTYFFIFFLDLVVFYGAYSLSKSFKRSILVLLIYIFLQISFGGNGLWFELALSPFLFYGLITIFLNKRKKMQLFITGLALAVSVLIKQNAILFYIPVIYFLISKNRSKDLFYIFFSGILLFLLTFIYLQNLDIFYNFYFLAVKLPITLSSQHGFVLLPSKKQYFSMFLLILPMIVLIGSNIKKVEKFYWISCAFIALMFAFPRYENFHLQVVVIFSSILSIFLAGRKFIIFFLISLSFFILAYPKIWNMPDRFLDPETYQLSNKIKNFDSVYLMNSPDLAYFLSNQLPSKPWAINFPWYFEQHNFSQEFITGLKREKIKYIVIGDRLGGGKYDLGNYLPEDVIQYIYKNYTLIERFNNSNIWKLN